MPASKSRRGASQSRRSRSPKRTIISRAKYSPKIVVDTVAVPKNSKSFNIRVVRDDLLKGGTKQRGLVPLLKDLPQKEFVMPAANDGLGQVALAHSAALLGKLGTSFVAGRQRESKATQLARRLGGNVIGVHPGYMTVRTARAREYTNKRNKARPGSTKLFELGVDDPDFEKSLLKELKLAIPKGFRKPRRVWVAVGSGLLMRVLGQLWPDAKLIGVQMGMRQPITNILDAQRAKNAKIYVEENYKFEKPTKDRPPYPAMASYDAKLWSWIKRYGQEGDLVWNVGIDE